MLRLVTKRTPPSNTAALRILLIQFRMIGDVLLNTPVVRALRQHYPQSYLAYCTEPIPAQVLQGNPWLDDVLLQPRPATWRQQLAMIARVPLALPSQADDRRAAHARRDLARHQH